MPISDDGHTKRHLAVQRPWSFDFYQLMRELERSNPSSPRIGTNTTISGEIVRLRQDPFLEFPASSIHDFEAGDGTPVAKTRFLGLFGPQGALPLNMTIEAEEWCRNRDDSFARFTDIFASRFIQLFFRSWADARPIAHLDRPDDNRYLAFLASFCGIGTPASARRGDIHDLGKVRFSGLTSHAIRSPTRLRQFLSGMLGSSIQIVERVPCWLAFEPEDRLRLGRGGALGIDTQIGGRVLSINDKFRVVITTSSFEEYQNYLPGSNGAAKLQELIFFYLGLRFDYDLQLKLPKHHVRGINLSEGEHAGTGRLGWTAWLGGCKVKSTNTEVEQIEYVDDARFSIADD